MLNKTRQWKTQSIGSDYNSTREYKQDDGGYNLDNDSAQIIKFRNKIKTLPLIYQNNRC